MSLSFVAPDNLTPMLTDPSARLSLDGAWRVRRWPFDAEESALAAASQDDGAWEAVNQPGPVFIADPRADEAGRENPAWMPPALARIEAAVRRDRHHPSLMFWSVGNENMPRTAEVADAACRHLRQFDERVKSLDPTRPTMLPPPGPANQIAGRLELAVGDIADIHYRFKPVDVLQREGRLEQTRAWDGSMETVTREQALARRWSGVWFSSEWGIMNMQTDVLHGPYLSVIADVMEDRQSGRSSLEVFEDRMRREWGRMRDDPTCLGGAYFPWICAGYGDNP